MKKMVVGLSLLSVCSAASTQSSPIQFAETSDTVLITTNIEKNGVFKKKRIAFMNIKATPRQQKNFMSYKIGTPSNFKFVGSLPSSANSSMSNVPVLDQGQHGTCVTFSNTAAVEALLNMGDSISQLCNLSLGSGFDHTLGGFGYTPSGWNGTMGEYVLEQMERFGVVSKYAQMTQSCGGMTQYPGNTPNITAQPMSPDQFYSLRSMNVMSTLDWSILLNANQRFSADPGNPYDGNYLVNRIKSIFAAVNPATGNKMLVTIGFQLYTDICDGIGACAKHSSVAQKGDTWVLSNAITQRTDFPQAGHEVIITGYDDNATAIDSNGTVHRGLFNIRNSWGPTVGDNGNYYMSYDYFMKFATEAHEIRTLPYQG